ncbi:unnamed protein product [Musa acuminata subsp. burmannicoides]
MRQTPLLPQANVGWRYLLQQPFTITRMKNNRKKHAIIPTLGTLDWHHTPTANGKEEKASHGAPLSQVPKKSPIPKGLVKKHLLTRMKGN